jgi:hypothetical protein
MTLTRTVLLAAVLLAIASRAAAGTAAIDLDLEEVHCCPSPLYHSLHSHRPFPDLSLFSPGFP